MTETKTMPTDASVPDFIAAVENTTRREDAYQLLELMNRITKLEPRLWGDSLIGYGHYRYKYKSGHGGEYFLAGFSPRKSAITIYIMPGFKQYEKKLTKLGKHKHSVSCLYVTRLANINLSILEDIITDAISRMKKLYPDWSP